MEKQNKVLTLVVVLGIVVLATILIIDPKKPEPLTNSTTTDIEYLKLKTFGSLGELKEFLNKSATNNVGVYYGRTMATSVAPSASGALSGANGASMKSASADISVESRSSDYSKTNIQVEEVDEADIVKNDGKYIYVVSGNKVAVIDAHPADKMKIISEINFSTSITNIFLNEDKLVALSNYYNYLPVADCLSGLECGRGNSQYFTQAYIYNIKNKENPVLERNISISGNYVDSRMIGDYVYLIANKYISNFQEPELPIYYADGVRTLIPAEKINYFDYEDSSRTFTTIASIDLQKDEMQTEVYLTGSASTVYVSINNIYLTYTKRISNKEHFEKIVKEVLIPLLPSSEKEKIGEVMKSEKPYYEISNNVNKIFYNYIESLSPETQSDFNKKLINETLKFEEKIQKETEKTVIHKIGIDKEKIKYKGVGEVGGHALNQFSMDEFEGKFRIATTTGEVFYGNSLNHLFVLDENLNQIGSVEDLAKGEKIYSARFVGERAYIVTFKKVDPLFVIDLRNPSEPKVLGYLKIPGYSDYLHPYDENHVIGIGKEAVDASAEEIANRNLDFAWYQGLKISLFDIIDVEHPKEKAKIVIGDRGTESNALYDYKAFLFDKDKDLLVIPIALSEINKTKYEEECKKYSDDKEKCANIRANAYGERVWQGAYVLNISLEGISVRGKITHNDNKTEGSQYWRSSGTDVKRSLYIGNALYTISDSKIKANDLQTIEEISMLKLPYESYYRGEVVYQF
jgi:uncharacterized secreted protein with C-terminal beta-propeller domain